MIKSGNPLGREEGLLQQNRARFSKARTACAAALAALIVGAAPNAAFAETVKGRIILPEALSGRRIQGYWRVANGTVPTRANAPLDAAVVLEGFRGKAPPARTYTVNLEGRGADKRLLIVGVGSVVEFTNKDKVAYELSVPAKPELMPTQRLAAGSIRRVKFSTTGAFEVRDKAHPGISVSIVVTNHPFATAMTRKGRFAFKNVPREAGRLKVWVHGRFVHDQELAASAATRNLKIAVSARKPSAEHLGPEQP